jgi:hypothetical protein
MIDPGINIDEIFGNVQLPCEAVRRLNNTLNAAELPDLPAEKKKTIPIKNFGIVETPKTLSQAEKSFKYPTQT